MYSDCGYCCMRWNSNSTFKLNEMNGLISGKKGQMIILLFTLKWLSETCDRSQLPPLLEHRCRAAQRRISSASFIKVNIYSQFCPAYAFQHQRHVHQSEFPLFYYDFRATRMHRQPTLSEQKLWNRNKRRATSIHTITGPMIVPQRATNRNNAHSRHCIQRVSQLETGNGSAGKKIGRKTFMQIIRGATDEMTLK